MTSIVTELDKEVSEFPHNKFTLFFSRFHSGLRYKLRAAEQAESGVGSRNGKTHQKMNLQTILPVYPLTFNSQQNDVLVFVLWWGPKK